MAFSDYDDDLAEEYEGRDDEPAQMRMYASSPAAAWAFATMVIVVSIICAACVVGSTFILANR